MTETSEPVAVIGVGTMGHGMAASALRARIPTIVWDRTPEATAASPPSAGGRATRSCLQRLGLWPQAARGAAPTDLVIGTPPLSGMSTRVVRRVAVVSSSRLGGGEGRAVAGEIE
jgi:NAD binding domain of 6-phosphogluconate dehydrogenase